METGKRLVLRYEDGQFTFRRIAESASDGQLLSLARAIIGFQEDSPTSILKIEVTQF